jgi:hypothetical protein
LNLITCRVRQRAFVIIHLREIAHIEEAAAGFALKNCSASLNAAHRVCLATISRVPALIDSRPILHGSNRVSSTAKYTPVATASVTPTTMTPCRTVEIKFINRYSAAYRNKRRSPKGRASSVQPLETWTSMGGVRNSRIKLMKFGLQMLIDE